MTKFIFHKNACKNDAKNYFLYFFYKFGLFSNAYIHVYSKKCIKIM